VFEQHHYLMDTHTAVASRVLRQYRETSGDSTPTVIVSTASPYKFAADVLTAVAGKNAVAGLDAFACSDELEARSGMPVPQQVKALRSLPIRHTAHCEKGGMAQAVLDAFGGK
jgi:threonine synthase